MADGRLFVRRFGLGLTDGTVTFRTVHANEKERQMRPHLQLVRLLCRSIDPTIYVRDEGDRRRLIDVLRIPNRCRESFDSPGLPQRYGRSATLAEAAQRTAKRAGMAPLSAFGDKAWHYLTSGWELQEHQDRQHERHERNRAEKVIDLRWPAGHSARHEQVRQAELDELRASWAEDPRRRIRTWQGWWLGG